MMKFIHRLSQDEDTIAAIATPPGDGGVGIIRISGSSALAIGKKVFFTPKALEKPQYLYRGQIRALSGDVLDEGLLVFFKAPRSFTGEDVVELHCHGGAFLLRKILTAVIEAGARPAGPGEFSKRGFLNGKMDLSQAEAIQNLIGAQNERALRAAQHQLEGQITTRVRSLQKRLLAEAAILEAWVDFPEEGLEFSSLEEISERLKGILQEITLWTRTFDEGKKLTTAISVGIGGVPNAGKSSLMNQLLGISRAIVTPIAGTTRDTIEAPFLQDGLSFNLIDTAGLRETDEAVEKEGIERSLKTLSGVDVVFYLIDTPQGLSAIDHHMLTQLPPARTIVIWNKIDISPVMQTSLSFPYQVSLSAQTGEGIEQLKKTLSRLVLQGAAIHHDQIVLTHRRHYQCLLQAAESLTKVIQGLTSQLSPEFITLDMRSTLESLGGIIGQDISDEILTQIFSTFCIGK